MTKIIQTRIGSNGDVHLDFTGFVGHDCKAEEDRLRRKLASLGLKVEVKLLRKLCTINHDTSRNSGLGAAKL